MSWLKEVDKEQQANLKRQADEQNRLRLLYEADINRLCEEAKRANQWSSFLGLNNILSELLRLNITKATESSSFLTFKNVDKTTVTTPTALRQDFYNLYQHHGLKLNASFFSLTNRLFHTETTRRAAAGSLDDGDHETRTDFEFVITPDGLYAQNTLLGQLREFKTQEDVEKAIKPMFTKQIQTLQDSV